MLEEGPDFPDLFSPIFHGTNTLHYLSMVGEGLKWKVNKKGVSNVDTGK